MDKKKQKKPTCEHLISTTVVVVLWLSCWTTAAGAQFKNERTNDMTTKQPKTTKKNQQANKTEQNNNHKTSKRTRKLTWSTKVKRVQIHRLPTTPLYITATKTKPATTKPTSITTPFSQHQFSGGSFDGVGVKRQEAVIPIDPDQTKTIKQISK